MQPGARPSLGMNSGMASGGARISLSRICFESIHGEKSTYSLALFAVIVWSIFLFQGALISDPDYPRIFRAILSSNFSAIDPAKGYLLEGVIEDAIGLAYTAAGFEPQLLWWCTGLTLLAIVTTLSVSDRSISFGDLILIIAFSRVIDTLFLWVGKFDPFLLSFLILTANKNKKIALAGIVLAAFCHPSVAVISTAGVVLVEAAFTGVLFPAAFVVALAAALTDIGLFHYLFPSLLDRSGLVWAWIFRVLKTGAHWGFISLVSSLLVPFLSIQYFRQPLRFSNHIQGIMLSLWVALMAVVAWGALDHTRVACLVTLAPLITLLRVQRLRSDVTASDFSKVFFVLLLSRLVIPHFAEFGSIW
jgi:hypothetical protein